VTEEPKSIAAGIVIVLVACIFYWVAR